MTDDDGKEYIKIHIAVGEDGPAGESVWAIKLGAWRAEICNIPFFTRITCLGDEVSYAEVDGCNEFLRVTRRKTRGLTIRYREGAENFKAIIERLKPLGVRVEGAFPGVASLAYPHRWSESRVAGVMERIQDLLEEIE